MLWKLAWLLKFIYIFMICTKYFVIHKNNNNCIWELDIPKKWSTSFKSISKWHFMSTLRKLEEHMMVVLTHCEFAITPRWNHTPLLSSHVWKIWPSNLIIIYSIWLVIQIVRLSIQHSFYLSLIKYQFEQKNKNTHTCYGVWSIWYFVK